MRSMVQYIADAVERDTMLVAILHGMGAEYKLMLAVLVADECKLRGVPVVADGCIYALATRDLRAMMFLQPDTNKVPPRDPGDRVWNSEWRVR